MLLLPLLKKCYICKINKQLIEFSKNKAQKDGLQIRCKLCYNQIKNQYRKNNPDKRRAEGRKYYKDNAEYYRQYRKDTTEYTQNYNKDYRQTEHGKARVKAGDHKYRYLLIANTPQGKNFTPADIILIIKLQKNKCKYCKKSIKKYYEIDHFIPISKNGSNEASNIQLLCMNCNRTKRATLPTDYAHKHNMLF